MGWFEYDPFCSSRMSPSLPIVTPNLVFSTTATIGTSLSIFSMSDSF